MKLDGLCYGRLLAGSRNLDREIEAVTSMEGPAEETWAVKNALILTAFYSFKDDLAAMHQAIDILGKSGCAVLVFQTGIIDHLPDEIVAHAEELGLPLIEVPEHIYYHIIIQPVVGAIFQEKTFILQRAEEIHHRLTDICLAGGGVGAVVAALSDLIDRPVVVVDTWGDRVASEHFDESINPEGDPFNPDKLARTAGDRLVRMPLDGFWAMKLASAGKCEAQGYILVYSEKPDMNALDIVAIEQASVIIALEMLKNRAVIETERRLSRDFIESLLGGLNLEEINIVDRARSLGWDLKEKRVTIVFDLEYTRHFLKKQASLPTESFEQSRTLFFEQALALTKQHHPKGIIAEQGQYIILLPECPKTFDSSFRVMLINLVESISNLLGKTFKNHQVLAAIGGFYNDAQRLLKSYEGAKKAIKIANKLSLPPGIIWYDDIALYDLLDRVVAQPEAEQWLERTIGPLLDYDRSHGTNMVLSLEAYFDANQQLKGAAYNLFVHPKTLKYRLERIRSILGADPLQSESQLIYYLACKLAKIGGFVPRG